MQPRKAPYGSNQRGIILIYNLQEQIIRTLYDNTWKNRIRFGETKRLLSLFQYSMRAKFLKSDPQVTTYFSKTNNENISHNNVINYISQN